jgi:uncharacterized protein
LNSANGAKTRKNLPVLHYDCNQCPAYCCSYEQIVVEPGDMKRLGKRFGLSEQEAERKFTVKGFEEGTRILRHYRDRVYGSACMFLDRKTRRCTVYEHRPEICRDFPGTKRCHYYDFLQHERRSQEDRELV